MLILFLGFEVVQKMFHNAISDLYLFFSASHDKPIVHCLFFSVLAYQKPNAKKLRRTAQRAEHLAAKGVVPRRQKLLLNRRPIQRRTKKAVAEANNNPDRDYYDIWDKERKSIIVTVFCSLYQILIRMMVCHTNLHVVLNTAPKCIVSEKKKSSSCDREAMMM